jgi:hypothetical protein
MAPPINVTMPALELFRKYEQHFDDPELVNAAKAAGATLQELQRINATQETLVEAFGLLKRRLEQIEATASKARRLVLDAAGEPIGSEICDELSGPRVIQ